jgi:hypothetical protein
MSPQYIGFLLKVTTVAAAASLLVAQHAIATKSEHLSGW